MTRVYMLGFILSRMLQPISFLVYLAFFFIVFLCSMDVVPPQFQSGFVQIFSPLQGAFVLTTNLICIVVITITVHFLYRVLVRGKYIMKLSMLGFLIALALTQIVVYFCLNLLPHWNGNTILLSPINGVMEMFSFVITGNLLALYVGVLSRGRFKKNIGFIDDSI